MEFIYWVFFPLLNPRINFQKNAIVNLGSIYIQNIILFLYIFLIFLLEKIKLITKTIRHKILQNTLKYSMNVSKKEF